MSNTAAQNAIDVLESTMRLNKSCTTDFEEYTSHYFAEGVYVREMRIPAGSVVVGKSHRYDEVCILMHGLLMLGIDGDSKIVQAPYTFTASPGKKAVYVLEDVIIANIHPNPSNTRDLAQIEAEVMMPEYNMLEAVKWVGEP